MWRKIVPNWPKKRKSRTQLGTFLMEDMKIKILFALTDLSIRDKDERILDSGCTYKICSNWKFFSSLEELKGGVS